MQELADNIKFQSNTTITAFYSTPLFLSPGAIQLPLSVYIQMRLTCIKLLLQFHYWLSFQLVTEAEASLFHADQIFIATHFVIMGKTRYFKLFCFILIAFASTTLCSSAPKQQLHQNEGNLNQHDFGGAQKKIQYFLSGLLDCSEGFERDSEKIGEKRLGLQHRSLQWRRELEYACHSERL